MVGTTLFPSLHGDPMSNGRSGRRSGVRTDFETTTNASMRWPRDVYEAGKGQRWLPRNVRRPEPGFTLTFKNDIGTKEESQPPTTDAKSCHYTLEQEPGRPVPGRVTTEAFSQFNAPTRYALNMRPDERYLLKKDKNQSVLPQQCGIPGPRVRVLEKGGGAPDWRQHTEEVMTSKDQYKLSGQGPHATDFRWTAGPDGRLPRKPEQSFTVRYMSDIGTQERTKKLTPAELIRSNVPLGPAPEYQMVAGGYDSKSSQLDAAAVQAAPERGAGKANHYNTSYDIINSGPLLNATGAYENFPAANSGKNQHHSGNDGPVRRRHMFASGAAPSYNPPPGVQGAWEKEKRDDTYKTEVSTGFGSTGRDNRALGMTNGWQNSAACALAPPWGTDN